MRKEFGIFLFCLWLCILAFLPGDYRGYANVISNWRNLDGIEKIDYSSNKIACNYYGGNSKWLRRQNESEILKRLSDGEVLRIGIDYYALTKLSRRYVPNNIIDEMREFLKKGGVVAFNLGREK